MVEPAATEATAPGGIPSKSRVADSSDMSTMWASRSPPRMARSSWPTSGIGGTLEEYPPLYRPWERYAF